MLRVGLVVGATVAVVALAWWSREPVAAAKGPSSAEATTRHPVVGRPGGAPRAPVVEVDDPVAFPPLGEPELGDWRAVHVEPPQSFHAWRTGPRRPPTRERRTLRVLAIDDVSRFGVTVDQLLEHLQAYYGLPALEAKPTVVPAFSTRDRGNGRVQTLTREVLRWLEGEVGSDTYCMLAVTSRDLFPDPSWNYVFGEASLVGRVGVFSFARMDPAFPETPVGPADRTEAERVLLLRRCLSVVTHEVGHMFGIEHCVLRRCLMNGSNHVAEMDRTPLHLCPTCLAKVVHATHVGVLERYRRLEAFYRANGLVEESRFVARRVDALTR